MAISKHQKFVRSPAIASLCSLGMQIMVGTVGGGGCGGAREVSTLCDVVVSAADTQHVWRGPWNACVLCQVHSTVNMFSVWVLMRCGLFVQTLKSDAMRWFEFISKRKRQQHMHFDAQDIVVPYVAGLVVARFVSVGDAHNKCRVRKLWEWRSCGLPNIHSIFGVLGDVWKVEVGLSGHP